MNSLQLIEDILKRCTADKPLARQSTTFGRLYAIGGSNRDKENNCISVERYYPRLNVWKRFHHIPGCRKYFSTIHFDYKFLIIGGENEPSGVPDITAKVLPIHPVHLSKN